MGWEKFKQGRKIVPAYNIPGDGELDLLEVEGGWVGPFEKNSWVASENSPSEDPHILAPGRGPRVSSPESPLRWRLVSSVC